MLTYGMGYSHQRFSPLNRIYRDNVKRLVPAWSYSMADNNGQQSHALIKDGVMYITDHAKTVALNALTGKQIWKSTIEYPPETTRIVCCGIINRGAAILDGKLFRTTLDANVIALDAKTGKELWRTKAAEVKDGYSMFMLSPEGTCVGWGSTLPGPAFPLPQAASGTSSCPRSAVVTRLCL